MKRYNGKWKAISYGLNAQIFPCRSNGMKGIKITKLRSPSSAAGIADANYPAMGWPSGRGGWNVFKDYPVRWGFLARHAGRANCAFMDGSAKSLNINSDIPNLSSSEGALNNADTTKPEACAFWFGNPKRNQ